MDKPKYIPPTIALHSLYTENHILDTSEVKTEGSDLEHGQDGGDDNVPEGSQMRNDGFNDSGFTPQSWE